MKTIFSHEVSTNRSTSNPELFTSVAVCHLRTTLLSLKSAVKELSSTGTISLSKVTLSIVASPSVTTTSSIVLVIYPGAENVKEYVPALIILL